MSDDIRAPVLWRRPNARTYTYNQVDKETELQRIEHVPFQTFGGSYYQPMINYIDTKNRQGAAYFKKTLL